MRYSGTERDEKLEKIIKVFVNRENTNKLTSSVPTGTNKNLTHRDLIVMPFVSILNTCGQKSKISSSEGSDKINETKMRT